MPLGNESSTILLFLSAVPMTDSLLFSKASYEVWVPQHFLRYRLAACLLYSAN